MKRILTATDFSPASDNALLYSVELAGIFKCPVTIVHAVFTQVLEPLTPDFYVEPIHTDQIEVAQDKLAQLRVQLSLKNISADTIVETGLPSYVISQVSDNIKADIVSVGSKGDNLVTFLAGNTATDLVTSSVKPLLVIPADVKFQPFKRVLFATSLKTDDIPAIRLLTEFLTPFDAEIEVLHVNTSKYQPDEKVFRDYSESVRKTFNNNRFLFRSVHLHHPAEVIELIASMDHADLIVLTKPHRGYWSELFHKSIVTEKIRKSSFPLLIIH